MVERTKTGIYGLDEIIGGGIPRGSCAVLLGGPGSGKTTFSMQFLYKGATEFNEPGIYMTLSESPDDVRHNMLQFGWDVEKLESDGKLRMIDARPITVTAEGYVTPVSKLFKGETIPFTHIIRLLYDRIKEIRAKRLAIDSLTVITMQYEREFDIRQGVLGLIQALSRIDCTSLIISEVRSLGNMEAKLEEFLAPTVLNLYYSKREGVMLRAIQALKMRGTKHSEQIHPLEIAENGIVVHPKERVMEI